MRKKGGEKAAQPKQKYINKLAIMSKTKIYNIKQKIFVKKLVLSYVRIFKYIIMQ